MVATLLIGVVVVTSVLAAASLRLRSLLSAVIAAYVLMIAEVAALTIALSPYHLVARTGLAEGEALLLVIVLEIWWLRGRPGMPYEEARRAAARILRDPIAATFLVLVAVALAYELLLVLTVPANNWDSLTYHLSRVAAWARHGGVYWIPNAPTDRMNEFQPVAEQQILFLFVATGKGALFALPQFVAQLATLVAIYGAARRLGYAVPTAACAALLFATFTLVALESTTSQNDLVAASLPAAAAALLLGGSTGELALAGVAVALGVGVKLTTALVLPVLFLLALRLGRRAAALFGAAAVAAFASVGMWGFVLNIVKTGHLLGHGGGRVEDTASPSFPGSVATAYRVLYRLFFDLSGFDDWMVWGLAGAGGVVALAALAAQVKRGRSRRATVGTAVALSIPLLAPALVLGAAAVAHVVARIVHLPVSDPGSTAFPFSWTLNRRTIEDYGGFGPLAGVVLIAACAFAIVAARRRSADAGRLALAVALPLFVVLLALSSKYNPYLSRFLIVPIALTAPLFAGLFGRREAAASIVVIAAVTLGLSLVRDQVKPLANAYGRPWHLTQAEAVELNWVPMAGVAREELDRRVPESACVGALLGADEPSYLLYGSRLKRDVTFLPSGDAPLAAQRDGVRYVVIGSTTDLQAVADAFKARGWALQPLYTSYWTLAVNPSRGSGRCAPSAARAA